MPAATKRRKGGVGAMMDEYERAALELRRILESVSEQDYARPADPNTSDENCRSIQTILSHVVDSGYSYADYFREQFSMPSTRPPERVLNKTEALQGILDMIAYTVETLEERWEMPEEEIMKMAIQSRWGTRYDLEQLMEHAIVHILRHRRQVEKFQEAQRNDR